MTSAALPFGPSQASGLEQSAGASPVALNVVVEATGAVRRRPGIVAIDEAPSTAIDDGGISALHRLESGDIVAVGGADSGQAHIYRVGSGTAQDLSTDSVRMLNGTGRPQLLETEMLLVLAAGGDIQKVTLADWQSARLGGSPPKSSHVVSNSLRLLANDVIASKTTVNYSDQALGLITYAGHEVWAGGTAGSFQAEARPDPVVALADTANEALVFGTKTLQVYGPDPTFVFVPVITLESGCVAPYSVVRVDGQFFWLNERRAIVATGGRQVDVLSSPALAQTLSDLERVDDAYGFRCQLGRIDAACWTFPTDGRTFVLQQNGGWAQWCGSVDGAPAALPILSSHNALGRCLVGTRDGRIGELSAAAQTDLGDAILAHATTGFLSHDTDAYKHCECVRLAIRHEFGAQGLVWLDFRDDFGAWTSLPIELDGSRGQLSSVEFRGLGTYRRRQWRIRFDGTSEVVLASAQEVFSVTQ